MNKTAILALSTLLACAGAHAQDMAAAAPAAPEAPAGLRPGLGR